MDNHQVLITTHAHKIYLLSFPLPTSTSSSSSSPTSSSPPLPTILSTLTLPEQPSYALQHPKHKDLIYVTSWVENKVFLIKVDEKLDGDGTGMRVLEERETGGEGPTYFVMTKNGDGLLIVHYRSGHLSNVPLDPSTGHFLPPSNPSPPLQTIQLPYHPPTHSQSPRESNRQDSSHPHHLVPIPLDSRFPSSDDQEDFLVPDLGSDRVLCVRFGRQEGWKILSSKEVKSGMGPRHALIRRRGDGHSTKGQDKEYLVYLVNELGNALTIHNLERDEQGIPTISDAIQTLSTMAPSLMEKGYAPKDPYEAIACTILATKEGTILVSNRNADEGLAPEGDSIVILHPFSDSSVDNTKSIVDNTTILSPSKTQHLIGSGRHLRGVSFDPSEKFLVVISRTGDGLSLYEKDGKSVVGWKPMWEKQMSGELDLAVGVLFLAD